ncbi:unnamed protein product [Closterium sp. Naga37s-1]|nr:unnamed protein product [Closterium sp. Naga37s-1]
MYPLQGYPMSPFGYPQQFQEGAGYAFPQGVFPPYGPQGFPAQPGMFVPPVGAATPAGMYPGYPPAAFGPTQAAQAAGGFPGGPSMIPSAPQPAGVAGVGAAAQPFGFQQMQGGQSQGFQGTGEQQQMGGASHLAGGPGAQPNPDLPVIQDLIATTGLANSNWMKAKPHLVYVLVYDLVVSGKGTLGSGAVQKVVLSHKAALRAALARLLVKQRAASVEELLGPSNDPPVAARESHCLLPAHCHLFDPRYVRVNTLRTTTQAVLAHFQAGTAQESSGTDGANEANGAGKSGDDGSGSGDANISAGNAGGRAEGKGRASCFPAFILAPRPGWHVLDACAAPGNKTSHVAALMENTGRLTACERDAKRATLLRKNLDKAGVTCEYVRGDGYLRGWCKVVIAGQQGIPRAQVHEGDFLAIDPASPEFADVQAILLDPSCSGSGTRHSRGDLLLSQGSPSPHDSIPAAERITYSTCSINERENEAAVAAVLPAADPSSTAHHLQHMLHQREGERGSGGGVPAAQRITYSTCSTNERENESVVAAVLPAALCTPPSSSPLHPPVPLCTLLFPQSQQQSALPTALPAAQRVTYSTCSINERENEAVVAAVLPAALANGFRLAPALPKWPRRGLPSYPFGEGCPPTLSVSFPPVNRLNAAVVAAVLPAALANGFRLAPALPAWPRRGLPSYPFAHQVVRTDPATDGADGFFKFETSQNFGF